MHVINRKPHLRDTVYPDKNALVECNDCVTERLLIRHLVAYDCYEYVFASKLQKDLFVASKWCHVDRIIRNRLPKLPVSQCAD